MKPKKSKKNRTMRLTILSLFTGFLLFILHNPIIASDIVPQSFDDEDRPTLPDLTHQLLALHAAESHGNTSEQIVWIAQGAYDEDHQPIPTFGWHSWDPDTGEYWWSPLGDGPALERANMLFFEAIALYDTNLEGSWKKFGQSLHLLQDLSTPAHAHADSHVCLGGIGDCDAYETWLGVDDLTNTLAWLNLNPSDPIWNKSYTEIPIWDDLTSDLQSQLDAANAVYGGYSSGRDLWELGPTGIDPVLFQLMFLMAESADNYNSGGISEYPGEIYNGDLDDPAYLGSMRDMLFPLAIQYSTMWIDYFEFNANLSNTQVFIPLLIR